MKFTLGYAFIIRFEIEMLWSSINFGKPGWVDPEDFLKLGAYTRIENNEVRKDVKGVFERLPILWSRQQQVKTNPN